MADSNPNQDYIAGYQLGLYEGFEQGVQAQLGPDARQPSRARIVGAWVVLGAGLVSGLGLILTSRKEHVGTGTAVLLGGSIVTSFVGALQVLTRGRNDAL